MKQISLRDWPQGLCETRAIVAMSADDVHALLGIHLESDNDGRDDFDGAIIRLPSGNLVALQFYRNAPHPGMNLITREGAHRDVAEAARLLRLRVDDFLWIDRSARNALRSARTRPVALRPAAKAIRSASRDSVRRSSRVPALSSL